MEIERVAGLVAILILTDCHSAGQTTPVGANMDTPSEWKFNFFTPKALPALVTFAVIQGVDGTIYRFNTLNSTSALPDVIGKWNDKDRASGGYWNHVDRPPKHFIFCWDSIIDKKVYETHLTVPDVIVKKMNSGSGKTDPYNNTYDTIQIGLAPEGKVAVWLKGIGFEPNYRITPSVLETFSGDKLDVCKEITRHPNGYKYYGKTPDFIKEKNTLTVNGNVPDTFRRSEDINTSGNRNSVYPNNQGVASGAVSPAKWMISSDWPVERQDTLIQAKKSQRRALASGGREAITSCCSPGLPVRPG
ncbi:DUF2931 family protein [uncultured Pantoea sp.]|uniref:DUF2931 family protein n=1 Tax=uncultured Pantoea sp. TaxID=218084 RepID=UPI0025FD779E|nr:DUF2931 family protein [uncultured Pantoea sp.]